ncbi:MAG: hypothetical protein JWM99_4905 [Verrucomicrobiales bacterium]|nr:hypothetical protein [Verrucomicrobiales bacterium]
MNSVVSSDDVPMLWTNNWLVINFSNRLWVDRLDWARSNDSLNGFNHSFEITRFQEKMIHSGLLSFLPVTGQDEMGKHHHDGVRKLLLDRLNIPKTEASDRMDFEDNHIRALRFRDP